MKETLTELPEMPAVIHWAIPVMLSLVILELVIGFQKKRKLYQGKDFFASLSIGTVNLLVSAAVKGLLIAVYLFFYNNMPWRIPHTWWSYILCIVAIDFCRYWAHRIAHESRFWWATHVTHHSSELYNLSVSFRLSWVQHGKIIFFLPAIAMCFDPVVFFICHQIEVLYQFWIHTEIIVKLPRPIEYIFTTPSHHRVHHAKNKQYLDKNYGSTFIIWDRMFGTFQPEEEKAEYGITTPINSFNPVYLVFHEWLDIAKDVKQAKNFKEAWFIIWGSPTEQYERKMAALAQEEKEKREFEVLERA